MDLGSHWLVWPVMLPLLAATAAFVSPRIAVPIGLVAALLTTLSVAGLARALLVGGAQRYTLAGWPAPLGIALYADGLSVVMLLMVAVVGAITSAYAAAYFRKGEAASSSGHASAYFWPLWLFLWAALNAIMFVLGMFLDAVAVLLIVTPIVLPLLEALDIDPVHFAIVLIVNMEIAFITPPIGLNLFVLASIARAPVAEAVKGVLPFIGAMVGFLLLVTYVPELSLWLPDLILGPSGR